LGIPVVRSEQSVRGIAAADNSYPIAGEGFELGGQPQPGFVIESSEKISFI
jgi:hypothetical protein